MSLKTRLATEMLKRQTESNIEECVKKIRNSGKVSPKVKLTRIITEMESKLEGERDSCPFCMMFREEGVSDYHLGSCEISLLWEVANDL
jgi:hypothetical protein